MSATSERTRPPTGAPRAGRRGAALTMASACLALFAIFLDNTVVNVALPTIQADLSAAPDQLEWIVNAYVVAFAGLVLLGGATGDRFGRRRVFVLALLLFAAASVVGAIASSGDLLIAARGLQGVGAAALAPLSLSLLADTFPRDRLPAAVGLWAGVSGLGLAVGPLVGGLLVDLAGWHAIFWVNVPIALAAALLARGRPGVAVRTPIDVGGAVLVTTALVSLVAGLTRSVRHTWTDGAVLGLLFAGIVLWVAFAARQRRAQVPLLPRRVANRGRSRPAGVALALASFALFGVLWYLTLYLQNVLGYGPIQAGLRTLPLTGTTLVVAPLAGKLAARRGAKPVLAAGLLVATIALAAMTGLGAVSSYAYLAVCLLGYGLGLALALPTAVGVLVEDADRDRVGIVAAVATMARQLGGALGLAVLAAIGARSATTAVHLPAPVAGLPEIGDLISGGRVDVVTRLAGGAAGTAVADGFLHGFRVVLVVASAATALALLAALRLRSASVDNTTTGSATSLPEQRGAVSLPPDDSPPARRWPSLAGWAAVVVVVVLALWALATAAQTTLAMVGMGGQPGRAAPPLFALHAATGAVALACGAVQLRLLRDTPLGRVPRRLSLHRRLGQIYVYAAWITSVAGLVVATRFDVGPPAEAAFAVEAIAWLVATTLAYVAARRRRLSTHRAWMVRSYALALFFVTFNLAQPAVAAIGLSRTATYAGAVLLAVGVNLAVAERVLMGIRKRALAP